MSVNQFILLTKAVSKLLRIRMKFISGKLMKTFSNGSSRLPAILSIAATKSGIVLELPA